MYLLKIKDNHNEEVYKVKSEKPSPFAPLPLATCSISQE